MSLSYQFKRDGEPIGLAEIDDKIRRELGLPESKTQNCTEFQLLINLGIGILINDGGSFVRESTFNKTMKRIGEGLDALIITLGRKYLYTEYTFHAWR
jgi:hypothetical protein